MSPLNEPSASSFLTAVPTSAAARIVLVASTLTWTAYIICAISPARHMLVLISALAAAEHSYIQGVESGSFVCEDATLAERLTSLQIDVSILREEALRDSLSRCAPFSRYFKFQRTFATLRCIREAQALETDIEILKEVQLRELPLEAPTAEEARAISMRRRQLPLQG